MLSRRPDESNFTFSGGGGDVTDEAAFRTWAERIKSSYNHFGSSSDQKVGAWTRRAPKSPAAADQFHWSDGGLPPLWEKSCASSPADERPLHPTPRAQAIARYRQEMLELVKDAPENAYELSLKDIVELSRKPGGQQSPERRNLSPGNKLETVREKKRRGKKEGQTKKITRSESMETGGLLLNMFVPASLGGRKSFGRGGGGGGGTRSKVTPKPVTAEGEKGERGEESEWWRKSEFSESSGSSSTGSGSSSTGSGRSRSRSRSSTRRKTSGCNPFFFLMKKRGRGF